MKEIAWKNSYGKCGEQKENELLFIMIIQVVYFMHTVQFVAISIMIHHWNDGMKCRYFVEVLGLVLKHQSFR